MSENQPVPAHLNPELVARFLDFQEKELVIRSGELELRKQADNNAFEYSKAALEANVKDRQAQRESESKSYFHKLFFGGVIILGLFVFLGTALFLDKDQIALEIIKIFLSLGGVGFGSYYYGKSSSNSEK